MVVLEFLQDVGVRGRRPALHRPLQDGQPEPLIEDDGELRRRPDVELLAGVPVDLILERAHLVAEPLGHLLEILDVDLHAGRLDPGQHGRERKLHVTQQALQSSPFDPLLHHRSQEADRRRFRTHPRRGIGEQLATLVSRLF